MKMTTATKAQPIHCLYVATDLTLLPEQPVAAERHLDVAIDGRPYRRLDPRYYAWLRSRMDIVRDRHTQGRMTDDNWEALRTRFNQVHTWAVEHIGEPLLLAAVRATDMDDYRWPGFVEAPPPHRYPDDGDWPFTVAVPLGAVEEVRRIQGEAIALGWTEAELLQNRGRYRFPCGPDWGLVCHLRHRNVVGEVREAKIEVKPRDERRRSLYFYRRRRPPGATA